MTRERSEHSPRLVVLRRRLESRNFYELCQEYRHAQVDAASQFEAIKTYLLEGSLPWPSYDE